ncbi:hypothetical protein Ahy_B05g077579 [Arachis hypogaea]|uniref:Uncharacterized protein n=1 Tax=Arachis hypogaea TaxID=3818 RepID=A0A444Z531_ARAHY|nr:hypothetical protein Ahy_B05g077579 [Arachis hypogaea]
MVRPPGSKRAPKSPKQRRKIAEAIAAKWADPDWEVLDTRLNADDMKLVANAYSDVFPVYIRDDRTDEDAFKKLTMYKPVIQKLIMYKAAAAITAAATAAVEGSKQEQKMLFNKSL